MKYNELANKAKDAFKHGLLYLIQNPVLSIWRDGGIGWQEIWKTAPYAGLYASCMSIELLSKAQKDGLLDHDMKDIILKIYSSGRPVNTMKINDLEHLISNIYENVTCAMNEDYPTKDDRDKKMRDANLNITLKSIKYLACSLNISDDVKDIKVISRCLQILNNSIKEDCSFSPAIETNDDSILTSYEAIAYLKPYLIKDENTFKCCLKYFENIVYENISIYSDADLKDRLLVSINIISRNTEDYSEDTIKKSLDLFKRFNSHFGDEKKIENRFHVLQLNNIQDIYHVSRPMMILDTIINFIENGRLPYDYINSYIDSIFHIINRVLEYGYYSYNVKDISFSVNYHALMFLWRISDFIKSNIKMRELEFMIVNPVLFQKQDFTMNENLVVALMPFRPPWSTSVYKAYKDAIESKGLTIWRSDIEHTDDQIIQTIWEKINQAKFIIADCTGRNPNVFYELGIAHTIGKPVFLCSQKDKDYPFDITQIRHFNYDLHDFPKLQEYLKAFIYEKFKI